MSNDRLNIFQALSLVMNGVRAIGKTKRNKAQGYAFRGIDDLMNAAGPEFRKHGIVVLTSIQEKEYDQVPVGKGTWVQCRLTVAYTFACGPDADQQTTIMVCAEALDNSDKATTKAYSYALRTALSQVLCVPTEEDQDPDYETPERGGHGGRERSAQAPSGGDAITPEQFKAIEEWLAAFEGEFPPEVVALGVSKKRTNRIDQLTKVEAQKAIDTFQAKAEERQ
jgi:hypothetical protein